MTRQHLLLASSLVLKLVNPLHVSYTHVVEHKVTTQFRFQLRHEPNLSTRGFSNTRGRTTVSASRIGVRLREQLLVSRKHNYLERITIIIREQEAGGCSKGKRRLWCAGTQTCDVCRWMIVGSHIA